MEDLLGYICSVVRTYADMRKRIIIIDEYDVPLIKAFSNGYYGEMVELV